MNDQQDYGQMQEQQPSPFEQYEPQPVPQAEEKVQTMLDSANTAVQSKSRSGLKGFFARPWRGEVKLWQAFWLYGIVGAVVLNVLLAVLAILGFAGLAIGGVLMLSFAVWNGVSVWRCARNAGAKIWGILARILVILSIPAYLFTVVGLFGIAAMGGVASSMSSAPEVVNHDMAIPQAVAPLPNGPQGSVPNSAAPGIPASPNAGMLPTSPSDAPLVAAPIAPAAPVAVPAVPVTVPAAPQAAPVAPAAPAMDACEQRMYDHAVANKADPKAYIDQNQAYLAECRKVLAGQPK